MFALPDYLTNHNKSDSMEFLHGYHSARSYRLFSCFKDYLDDVVILSNGKMLTISPFALRRGFLMFIQLGSLERREVE